MMKFAAVAALVGSAVAAPMYSEGQYTTQWQSYKQSFGKAYGAEAEASHYATFKANVDLIDSENKKGETDGRLYQLGLTEYTDWTSEEFVATKLSGAMRSNTRDFDNDLLNSTGNTMTVDWRAKGAVTPIKNQGECGACWAFSAVGAMEGLSKIDTGTLLELSEQQLIDCSKKQGNQGCDGGLMDDAFKYAAAEGGMCSEKSYKFDGKDGECKVCKPVFGVTGHKDVPPNNERALAAAVQKVPVSIAIDASQPAFQHYIKGILHGDACGTKLDHGVLIVGYGTYSGEETSDADVNFWVVKNQWGPKWGNKGYVYILKDGEDRRGTCGIAMQPSYPTGGKVPRKYGDMEDVAAVQTPF